MKYLTSKSWVIKIKELNINKSAHKRKVSHIVIPIVKFLLWYSVDALLFLNKAMHLIFNAVRDFTVKLYLQFILVCLSFDYPNLLKIFRQIALRSIFCTLLLSISCCLTAQIPSLLLQEQEKKADSFQLEEKHYEALEIYRNILKDYEQSLSEEQRLKIYLKTGNSLMHTGQDTEARRWFRKVINAESTLLNEKVNSDAATGLGRTYEYTGKSDSAFYWYLKAYQMVEESSDTDRKARGARNIAQLLRVLKRFEEANIYCREAVNLIPGINDYKVIANIYNETAYLFELSQQYDSASYYYEKLIEISEQNNYLKGESAGYNNLASVFEKTDRYQEALDLKLKGLEIDRRINDTYGIMTSLISLTKTYILIDDYPSAYKSVDEAYSLCDTSWIVDMSEIHFLYYQIFKKRGNVREALNNYEKHIALRDTISHNKSMEKVMDLLANYETEKKEQQILFLEQANLLKENKIRLQWMMMGIFLLAGLLITSAGWSWIKYKNHKIKLMQMEIQQFLLRQRSNKNLDETDQHDNDQDGNLKKWGLTSRENEILYFLSQGCSNAKIAEKLFISENTVKFHIKNIYLKLNVKNRMEALLRCTHNDSLH